MLCPFLECKRCVAMRCDAKTTSPEHDRAREIATTKNQISKPDERREDDKTRRREQDNNGKAEKKNSLPQQHLSRHQAPTSQFQDTPIPRRLSPVRHAPPRRSTLFDCIHAHGMCVSLSALPNPTGSTRRLQPRTPAPQPRREG